jgi:hypothetical protein
MAAGVDDTHPFDSDARIPQIEQSPEVKGGVGMLVVLAAGPTLIALAAMYRLIGTFPRRRRATRDPLAHVFQPHELRELDAHLEVIADEELRRLDASIARYVAGNVGHVVVISDSRHGIALVLSDGRRIALGGVSRFRRRLLVYRAAKEKLRPTRVDRDGLSYRLLLRSEAGTEIEVYTRRLTLAP